MLPDLNWDNRMRNYVYAMHSNGINQDLRLNDKGSNEIDYIQLIRRSSTIDHDNIIIKITGLIEHLVLECTKLETQKLKNDLCQAMM